MKQFITFTTGAVIALLIGSHLAPGQNHHDTQVVYQDRIVVREVVTSMDINQLRDTSRINPDLEDSLNAECAYAIQNTTDEPLMGIVLHIERWWQGDACAAYEHLVLHGWY